VKKYAALKPEEPNPQDTLGEILLMVGQFEESEAAFRKAAAISPRFWNAWEGVAMTRFYRGDWAGGREMLAKAREAATRPTEKLAVDEETARSYEAEGKAAEAMKALDALEREAKVLKVETHWVAAPLAKARALSSQGKHKEALARVAEAASRREKASALPLGFVRNLRVRESMARLVAEAALGQPTGARKSLAEIEEDARKSPGNAWTQSLLHLARGLAGVAQGNDKAAARHFSQCLGADTYCQWRLLLAQEKVGDKAGAAATRDRILKTRHRDASYLYVWSRLGATGQAGRRPSVE
jgi:tetratricopeptide (TPR) repeat protein